MIPCSLEVCFPTIQLLAPSWSENLPNSGCPHVRAIGFFRLFCLTTSNSRNFILLIPQSAPHTPWHFRLYIPLLLRSRKSYILISLTLGHPTHIFRLLTYLILLSRKSDHQLASHTLEQSYFPTFPTFRLTRVVRSDLLQCHINCKPH